MRPQARGADRLVAGRYRLLDQLGRGAMGIVWRGHDELLDREVAIKQVLLPPMASDADATEAFSRTLREARSAARLSHPGVVTVFDVIEQDQSPWIVMELIRARPLDLVIAEDGPLPPGPAALLGLRLLDALTTAHEAGVLHRDVKPSNVLISNDGQAVLTDFGIATIQGDPGLTQAGLVVGTPGFTPPERVRGEAASTASDLWSLGATLYAAVEGRGPFDRAGGSAAIIASVATEPAPRAPSAGPLGSTIEALLRADPARRPSATAAREMLTEAAQAAAGWGEHRVGAGPFSSGPLGSGPLGSGPLGSGPLGSGPLGSGPLGSGPLGSGPLGSGPLGSASAGAAGMPPGSPDPEPASWLRVKPGPDPGQAPGPGPRQRTSDSALANVQSPGTGSGGRDEAPDLTVPPVFANLAMPVRVDSGGPNPAAAGPGQSGTGPGESETGPGQPGVREPGTGAGSGESGAGPSRPGVRGPGTGTGPGGIRGPGRAGAPGTGSAGKETGGGAFGRVGSGGPAGVTGSSGRQRLAPDEPDGQRSRRGLELAGAITAAAIVVIAVWFAFPDLRSSLTQGLTQSANGKAVSASQAAARSTTASLRPRVSPTPGNGTGGPGSSGQPGQSHSAAGSQKGNHSASPSGPPGKSGKPSPSSPAPPAGYIWRVIPASVSGAVAGIQVATPAGWAMTAPGQVTRVTAPGDGTSLTFNLRSFALTPLAEATARESAALLSGAFPGYHLISLGTVSYRGFAAASWRFRWQPKGSPYEMYATELFFIAPVSAGPLPCVMSITVPGAALAAANSVLTVAKQTFKTLP